MVIMKSILCPTDFSEFSDRALVYAADLARRFQAKLYVQHVKEEAYNLAYNALPEDIPPMALAYEHDIDERVGQRLGQPPDLNYTTLVISGNPHEEILNAAKVRDADLIVMGTHGRSGLKRLVLGSVTEQVIKKAPCPVLAVCHTTREGIRRSLDFRTILVPVDFSDDSLRALEYALALMEAYGSVLWVLHVGERVPEAEMAGLFDAAHYSADQYVATVRERLIRMIPENLTESYRINELVKIGNPQREIVETARNIDADLVVMGLAGRGALQSALLGSTVCQVIKEVPCPVLTVRQHHTREMPFKKKQEAKDETHRTIDERA